MMNEAVELPSSGEVSLEEAALRAWSRLGPAPREPHHIESLQRARKRGVRAKGKRTAVVRLHGATADGGSVIAKRTRAEKAAIERAVYEHVLPRFAVPALHYFGSTPDEDGEYEWLFIEDAGGEPCTFASEDERALVGRWLACLHVTAVHMHATDVFATRDPAYYLEELRSSHRAITGSLDNPVLTDQDRVVLNTITSQFDVIEQYWPLLEAFCQKMPHSLVHGHLEKRNLRLRTTECGPALLVFDWETATLGAPAIDFAQWMRHEERRPALEYLSIVNAQWPSLSMEDVRSLRSVGVLFKIILSIGGSLYGIVRAGSPEMDERAAGDQARWCMHDIAVFQTRLEQSVAEWRAGLA